MFDVQQLLSGPHTASLAVNNLFGSYSSMMWDYAYVNETLVTTPAPEPTTSASITLASGLPTISPTSSSSKYVSRIFTVIFLSLPHSSSDTGIIVGGVLGGVALMIIGALAILLLRQKKRQNKVHLTVETEVRPFDPHPLYDPPHPGAQSSHRPESDHNTMHNSSSPPLVPSRRHPSIDQMNVIAPFPSSQGSSSSGRGRKQLLGLSNTSSSRLPDDNRSAPSSTSPRGNIPPTFTDEQADFINGLYNNNLPAAAVARVMERMLADRHAGIREWQRELHRTNSLATTAPPSYDLIDQSQYSLTISRFR